MELEADETVNSRVGVPDAVGSDCTATGATLRFHVIGERIVISDVRSGKQRSAFPINDVAQVGFSDIGGQGNAFALATGSQGYQFTTTFLEDAAEDFLYLTERIKPGSGMVVATEESVVMLDDPKQRRVLRDCTVLGGAGLPLERHSNVKVTFDSESLRFGRSDGTDVLVLPLVNVTGISIGGPGAVTKGGGFIGGGFGLEGAAIGIGIASILNAITTRTKIFTVVQIATQKSEVFLHYGYLEPSALRIELSPVFVALGLHSST